MAEAAAAVAGEAAVDRNHPLKGVSEDFSHMMELKPGAIATHIGNGAQC